jgi:hypothetical protein
VPDEVSIAEFRSEADAARWVAIDDVVMGGRSRSALSVTPDGTGFFSGDVSAENNGGFASVRSLARRLDLVGLDGFRLRVRGDGKRYKFCVRNEASFDGVVYQAAFEPAGQEWQSVDLPFERFMPTFRGKFVPAAGPLDRSRILTLGFMISDRQLGPFRLEIAWIAAYSAAGPAP